MFYGGFSNQTTSTVVIQCIFEISEKTIHDTHAPAIIIELATLAPLARGLPQVDYVENTLYFCCLVSFYCSWHT